MDVCSLLTIQILGNRFTVWYRPPKTTNTKTSFLGFTMLSHSCKESEIVKKEKKSFPRFPTFLHFALHYLLSMTVILAAIFSF